MRNSIIVLILICVGLQFWPSPQATSLPAAVNDSTDFDLECLYRDPILGVLDSPIIRPDLSEYERNSRKIEENLRNSRESNKVLDRQVKTLNKNLDTIAKYVASDSTNTPTIPSRDTMTIRQRTALGRFFDNLFNR